MKPNYEVLIFDLDDTLIDERENIRFAFKQVLKEVNEEYDIEKFNEWNRIDKQFWLDRQNGKIDVPEEYQFPQDKMRGWVRAQRFLIYFNYAISLEQASALNNLYMEAMQEIVVPIDGVQETLDYLHSKYKIIVATNGPSVAAQHKLQKINCWSYIDDLLCADMVGKMKPSPIFFDEIIRRMGIDNLSKYLMIGDSLKSDVEGASLYCFDSCWFNWKNEESNANYLPTYTIKKLGELKDLL